MWSSKFLVEVAVKFGVLLDIPTNEVRKSPRNHVSCSILKCAFNAKNIYIEKGMDGSIFLRWFVPYYTPLGTVEFTSIAIDMPKEYFLNEHMLQGFFLEEYIPMSLWAHCREHPYTRNGRAIATRIMERSTQFHMNSPW